MIPRLLRGPWCGAPGGSEKQGVVVLVVAVAVVVVTTLLCPCRGCSVTGITAVQWTLLHNVSVSWNQASVLCRMRGLHLPAPRSHLAMGGLQQALLTWAQWLPDGLWLGLYSEEPGQKPRRWEGDCGSLCTEVSVWEPGEPDEPSRQMCVRAAFSGTLQNLMWKTEACDATFPVVCEVDLGRNCTFEVFQSNRVTSSHVNMTLSDISDITSCLSACQNTTMSGLQCVAVQRNGVYDTYGHTCQLLFGPTLLTTADLQLDFLSTTALRQCFTYDVDDPVTSADWADTGLYPRPVCPCNQSSSSSSSSSPPPATSTTSSMGWTSRYCEQSTSDTTLSTSVPPDGLQAGGTVTNVSVDDHPWTTDDPAAGQGQSGDTASDSDAVDQHQPAANQSALTSTTSLSPDPNQQHPDGQDQSSWNSITTLPPQSSQADTDGGHRSSQTSTTTVPANESQLSSDGQLQSRDTTTATFPSNQQTSTTVHSTDPSQLVGDGGGETSQTSTTSVPADPGQLDSNGKNGSTHATTTTTLSADPNLSDDAGQLGSPHNATTSPPVHHSQDEGDGQHGPVQTTTTAHDGDGQQGPVQTTTTALPDGSGARLSSTPPSATADVSPPGSTTSTVTSDSSITPAPNGTQRHTDRPRLCTCQKVTCAPTSPPPLDPDLLPTIPLKATRKNRQRYESTWTEGTVSTLTITTVSITICSVVVVAVVAMDVRQLVVDFQRLHAVK